MALLQLLLLPFRAPLLVLLFGVALVMGNHWTQLQVDLANARGMTPQMFWTVELVQCLVVVVICTMPDLLMRRLSLLMVSSRVISLVVTLLLVITSGIYLLRLNLLADLLIVSSAVLLARLDLTRVGFVPPSLVMMVILSLVLFSGIWVGYLLPSPTASLFATG